MREDNERRKGFFLLLLQRKPCVGTQMASVLVGPRAEMVRICLYKDDKEGPEERGMNLCKEEKEKRR